MIRSSLLLCVLLSSASASPPAPGGEERKGWFGIGLQAADDVEQKALGVDRPVPRVDRIFRDSPAEKAGVQVGDYVLAFEGVAVADVKDLVGRVGGTAPGTIVTFSIRRKDTPAPIALKAVLDLRVDQQERFRAEWMGRVMPSVAVTGVRESDGNMTLGGDATKGKVVVVDYFATWCGPCKRVMPHLERLHRELQAKGLLVVGVSSEEAEVLRPFLAERPLAYRVAFDASGAFGRDMGVSVLPTVWLIDREGVIREIYFGAGHEDAIEAATRAALGLPPEVSIEQPSQGPAPSVE